MSSQAGMIGGNSTRGFEGHFLIYNFERSREIALRELKGYVKKFLGLRSGW
jgi:hypothetical protein